MAQRLKTDWILFFTVLGMVFSGVLIVYSASSIMAQMDPRYHSAWYFVERQAAWGVLALASHDGAEEHLLPQAAESRGRAERHQHRALPAGSRLLSRPAAIIAGSALADPSACSLRNLPSRRW